ncbi:MAG: NAD-binding protein, partial [Alphaproteobacteria bacterium]|nr:NAD-binding protein [Alphaproteobacteria bacterium]
QNVVSTISNPAINIKIIEKDVELAELLSENINNIEVLNGDPLNPEILNSANISDSGIVISLTADDKINILSCLLAKKLGAKRVSAILNDSSYADLLYSLGINSILNSRASSISKILHYLKKGNIEEVTEFNNEIEVVAIEVSDNSHAIGSLSDDIISKNEIYISAIIRDDNIFIMPKKMLIASGDKILFTLTKRSLDKILKLFQEKPKYLI